MPDDRTPPRATILNAVIHLTNEQPLMADLFGIPSATDQALVCTNLRTMAGKRPLFADHTGSIFLFPYHLIRFIEVHPSAEAQAMLSAPATPATPDEPEADIEIDEDFLRRIRDA